MFGHLASGLLVAILSLVIALFFGVEGPMSLLLAYALPGAVTLVGSALWFQ